MICRKLRLLLVPLVLALLVGLSALGLIFWLQQPAQAQTISVGISEALVRRALWNKIRAYSDAAQRGDEVVSRALWVLPDSLPESDRLALLHERRSQVTRQLVAAGIQDWDVLGVEWWSPACCEHGSGPVALGDSADGARVLVQFMSRDGRPVQYTFDVFDAPGGANWGKPETWAIRDIYLQDEEPLYWRRRSGHNVIELSWPMH